MSVLDRIKNTVGVGDRSPEVIREDVVRGRQRMETIKSEILSVNGPLPSQEVVRDVIPRLVKQAAAQWLSQNGMDLVEGSRRLCAPPGSPAPKFPFGLNDPVPWGYECAVRPADAARGLSLLVEAHPYQAGLPTAERPARIEELTRELKELETADEALVDEHNTHEDCQAGGEVFHLPAVRSRRLQEEADRKRAGDPQAKERAANRTHRAAPVRSGHIERWAAGRRAARGEE